MCHETFARGNAMTASILSACLFSLMCFALPTSSGAPVFSGPSPMKLQQVRAISGNGDPDDDEATLELPGWKELDGA